MSAFTVNQDTIDLIVSTAVIGGLPTLEPGPDSLRDLVAHADRVGQSLWEANFAAVNRRYGITEPVPPYQWIPVAELMGFSISLEQATQAERSRLCLVAQSSDHPDWEGSPAKAFTDRLGDALKQRLTDSAVATLPTDARSQAIDGVKNTFEVWERSAGFGPIARPTGSSKI